MEPVRTFCFFANRIQVEFFYNGIRFEQVSASRYFAVQPRRKTAPFGLWTFSGRLFKTFSFIF